MLQICIKYFKQFGAFERKLPRGFSTDNPVSV